MEPRTNQPAVRLTPHLMFGLMIILIGVVFTLDNLNIAHAEDYLRFLSAGSSLYPLDALKLAGVDMTTPQPVEETFDILAQMVDRLEELTKTRERSA